MTQTTNYQLNQWEATDQVKRTDFNADNAKIDAALGALTAAAATIPKVAAGSYHGDGTESKFISVGFTPKAVWVIPVSGNTYSSGIGGGIHGGLAVTGSPATQSLYNAIEITNGGFRVMYKIVNSNSSSNIITNHGNLTYNYLAIG